MNKPTSIAELGRNYQIDLFHEIIVDPKFGETVIDKLEAKHFSVEVFQKIITIVKKYYEKHETLLNFPNLRTEIDMNVPGDQAALKAQLMDTVSEIESKDVTNKNVQKFASDFCKMQSLKNVVQEISKKLDRGIVDEYDNIEKKLKDALIYKETEDAISVFFDIDNVLSQDYRDPIATGIEGIDELIGGGLASGELGLVIAPLGVGKTTFLTKVANEGYERGKNVLYVFFEDKQRDIQRKQFAIMSGLALHDLTDETNRNLAKKKVERVKERHKEQNELFLQKLPADGVTITKIKNIIKKINATGKKIDLLVIDYIDCLSLESSMQQSSDEWANEGKVMRLLETMIEEVGVACWTATQGNRSSTSLEVVKTENMGGSLKKAQIAHFIMSIGKTLEQKEENVATITILKNRLGKDGMIYQNCTFHNGTLQIDTRESVSVKGFEDGKDRKKADTIRNAYLASQEEKREKARIEENAPPQTIEDFLGESVDEPNV